MNKYINDLAEISTFTEQHPHLIQQRKALGSNGKLAPIDAPQIFLGSALHNAGMSFLERIHAEVFTSRPIIERQRILADQEALANEFNAEHTLKVTTTRKVKPELTPEYLQSLGIPTSLSAMSSKGNDEELLEAAA